MNKPILTIISLLSILAIWLSGVLPAAKNAAGALAAAEGSSSTCLGCKSFVPVALSKYSGLPGPKVNAPFFPVEASLKEMAIFWFGHVDMDQNYAHVRIGYTPDTLSISITAFDRLAWYDKTPAEAELEMWDAATVYLSTNRNKNSAPGPADYQFIAQLSWAEPRAGYQAGYQGNGGAWDGLAAPFTTSAGWRGDAPNNLKNDNGWTIQYEIPFSSLGINGAPPAGTSWNLGVALHDRDGDTAPPNPDQTWPADMDRAVPATWGELAFGLPEYSPPAAAPAGTILVRHGLNGAVVTDGMAGGFFDCGSGYNRWSGWGEANYFGAHQVNIQNQKDVSDFPCFSRLYIKFPLDQVPQGAVILSANLTLYHFSNAGGGGVYADPLPSLIQVSTTRQAWDEATLTWNNSPLAVENISQSWVPPILGGLPPEPGVARTWDVSRAAAQAFQRGELLQLALFSADEEQHSGKYFYSSDAAGWLAEGRPSLEIVWGYP
jgi:hypothetical protein